MGCFPISAALAAAITLLGAARVDAQIDYRNLDDERPVASEDAYPVERYAFELLVPYRFESEPGGRETHLIAPEVSYGLLSNTQVGLEAPLAAVDAGAGTDWGLAGLELFALHNFNTEGRWLPALSLRGDLTLPVGDLAGDAARFTLKGIATRSWGRTRLHLNGAWTFGSEDALAPVESAPRWAASAAIDRTLIRSSLLLVAEVAFAEERRGAPTEVNASAGARWQWTPTLVLDAGVTRRLRTDVGPDLGLTVGMSYAFAVRGWMPAGPR